MWPWNGALQAVETWKATQKAGMIGLDHSRHWSVLSRRHRGGDCCGGRWWRQRGRFLTVHRRPRFILPMILIPTLRISMMAWWCPTPMTAPGLSRLGLLSLPGSLRRVKWYGMIKGLLVLRSWVSLIISHENKFAMYADQIYIFTYFRQFP